MKLRNAVPSVLGILSSSVALLVSSFNVCSIVCSGAASFFSITGVLFGMFFLKEYLLYLWGISAILFLVSMYFYIKHRSIPAWLLLMHLAATIISAPL